MRELKFRAWSNTEKEYNYKVLVGNSNSKDENYTCHSVLVDGDWLHFDELCGVIEQYAGLKDKNGNAIYEGDIVNMHFFEQYLGLNGGVGEKDGEVVGVIGVNGIGTFIKANNKKYYLLNYLEDAEYCADARFNEELEVVGNIHKNSELLEKK